MAFALHWFRQDLRLSDNPALRAAAETGAVVPVFVWCPEEEGDWAPGPASRWWLHHSLLALDASLRQRGSKLIVRRGPAADALLQLARETGAALVCWNQRYEPHAVGAAATVQRNLEAAGIRATVTASGLLTDPATFSTRSGAPWRVFTPFWHAVTASDVPRPLPAPSTLPLPPAWPRSLAIADLGLVASGRTSADFSDTWTPGEQGAHDRLRVFVAQQLAHYERLRDRPDGDGVSRLSPHLHFGEITAAQVWHAVASVPGSQPFLRQLAWRDFAHHLLAAFPHTPTEPLRPEFASFPWRDDVGAFEAWCYGRTGVPFVDAGMRELAAMGWMHNRARLAVASFLTKDLLIPWQQGARWFWESLVDADLANNTLGWQWTAGCGADAAPYFRIVNPVLQGQRFDPEGAYVRRWIPELARLPSAWIHRPWEAPADVLKAAGVRLGHDYPFPIVEHRMARERALAAFRTLGQHG